MGSEGSEVQQIVDNLRLLSDQQLGVFKAAAEKHFVYLREIAPASQDAFHLNTVGLPKTPSAKGKRRGRKAADEPVANDDATKENVVNNSTPSKLPTSVDIMMTTKKKGLAERVPEKAAGKGRKRKTDEVVAEEAVAPAPVEPVVAPAPVEVEEEAPKSKRARKGGKTATAAVTVAADNSTASSTDAWAALGLNDTSLDISAIVASTSVAPEPAQSEMNTSQARKRRRSVEKPAEPAPVAPAAAVEVAAPAEETEEPAAKRGRKNTKGKKGKAAAAEAVDESVVEAEPVPMEDVPAASAAPAAVEAPVEKPAEEKKRRGRGKKEEEAKPAVEEAPAVVEEVKQPEPAVEAKSTRGGRSRKAAATAAPALTPVAEVPATPAPVQVVIEQAAPTPAPAFGAELAPIVEEFPDPEPKRRGRSKKAAAAAPPAPAPVVESAPAAVTPLKSKTAAASNVALAATPSRLPVLHTPVRGVAPSSTPKYAISGTKAGARTPVTVGVGRVKDKVAMFEQKPAEPVPAPKAAKGGRKLRKAEAVAAEDYVPVTAEQLRGSKTPGKPSKAASTNSSTESQLSTKSEPAMAANNRSDASSTLSSVGPATEPLPDVTPMETVAPTLAAPTPAKVMLAVAEAQVKWTEQKDKSAEAMRSLEGLLSRSDEPVAELKSATPAKAPVVVAAAPVVPAAVTPLKTANLPLATTPVAAKVSPVRAVATETMAPAADKELSPLSSIQHDMEVLRAKTAAAAAPTDTESPLNDSGDGFSSNFSTISMDNSAVFNGAVGASFDSSMMMGTLKASTSFTTLGAKSNADIKSIKQAAIKRKEDERREEERKQRQMMVARAQQEVEQRRQAAEEQRRQKAAEQEMRRAKEEEDRARRKAAEEEVSRLKREENKKKQESRMQMLGEKEVQRRQQLEQRDKERKMLEEREKQRLVDDEKRRKAAEQTAADAEKARAAQVLRETEAREQERRLADEKRRKEAAAAAAAAVVVAPAPAPVEVPATPLPTSSASAETKKKFDQDLADLRLRLKQMEEAKARITTPAGKSTIAMTPAPMQPTLSAVPAALRTTTTVPATPAQSYTATGPLASSARPVTAPTPAPTPASTAYGSPSRATRPATAVGVSSATANTAAAGAAGSPSRHHNIPRAAQTPPKYPVAASQGQASAPRAYENYDISELKEQDSSEDEEKPKKKIPPWAKGSPLMRQLSSQSQLNAEELFQTENLSTIELKDVFNEAKRKKDVRKYTHRNSSANWTHDALKAEELARYNLLMQQQMKTQ